MNVTSLCDQNGWAVSGLGKGDSDLLDAVAPYNHARNWTAHITYDRTHRSGGSG